eukprot:2164136-Amphidinium_carterae.1
MQMLYMYIAQTTPPPKKGCLKLSKGVHFAVWVLEGACLGEVGSSMQPCPATARFPSKPRSTASVGS